MFCRAIDAGNGVVYVIDSPCCCRSRADGGCRRQSSPVAEGLSAQDVFNALDADGDGLVTEAELRAAAEARGIQLTEEQVAAFLAADAEGNGLDVDEYLTSLDSSVLGNLVIGSRARTIHNLFHPENSTETVENGSSE
jgi:hypothetical protein